MARAFSCTLNVLQTHLYTHTLTHTHTRSRTHIYIACIIDYMQLGTSQLCIINKHGTFSIYLNVFHLVAKN